MLRRLSGRTHEVISAVSLVSAADVAALMPWIEWAFTAELAAQG